MPAPVLNEEQLAEARGLLAEVEFRIARLADGDPELVFAYRRKVAKELIYLERGKPERRRRLKKQKWKAQEGLCAECGCALEMRGSVLDRKVAILCYTSENVDLLHHACDRRRQDARRFL